MKCDAVLELIAMARVSWDSLTATGKGYPMDMISDLTAGSACTPSTPTYPIVIIQRSLFQMLPSSAPTSGQMRGYSESRAKTTFATLHQLLACQVICFVVLVSVDTIRRKSLV